MVSVPVSIVRTVGSGGTRHSFVSGRLPGGEGGLQQESGRSPMGSRCLSRSRAAPLRRRPSASNAALFCGSSRARLRWRRRSRVDDLDAYLDRAEKLGGKRLVPPTDPPADCGRFAVFTDPDGNQAGLRS